MRFRVLLSLALVCLSASTLFTGCASSPSGTTTTTTPPAVTTPTVTSVSPSVIPAGAASTTLTIAGTGFTSATVIQVGSVVDATTFVSSTQVTAAVAATQLTQGALLPIIALNGSVSSASGAAINLEIDNPQPAITQFVPLTALTGGPQQTVSITGTGFVPTSVVQAAGTNRATAYVSSTQVNAVLTAADFATAGSLALMVVNPAPGGGTSAAASLAINNPVPGPIVLSPATLVTGASSPATVSVMGTNFLPTSTVQVGGVARPTTFVSATQLTFQLSVADQAAAAKLSITVANPAPGGGVSTAATFSLVSPTPTPVLTQVTPTQFLVNSTNQQIFVYGTNFTTSSVVQWNGTALTTTYITGTGLGGPLLAGSIPNTLLTTAGTASITVMVPTAPAVSNALSVSIVNPPAPTLISISPASAPIHTSTLVTLSGSGFTANSTVSFNGANLPATYVGSSTLTVTIPASAVALPGNGSFTVTTPAPGGGTTVPLVFTSYIGIVNNSMVYNPVNGLFYVSVPSSAGVPYGNSVVSVDPETGALGIPIQVGSEPNKLALSSDGTILWVGLDGASAVRQVNLTTNTAGLQFTLGGNSGVYANPGTALALAALPGSPNSVVVSSTNEFSRLNLAIYDSGVLRGASTQANSSYNSAYALQVNGTKSEIYAGGSAYNTYTYSSTGIAAKAVSTTSVTYANYAYDEVQIANGIVYTDFGGAYDAESGSLLGTFYNSGSTPASGSTTVDTTLAKLFVLDNSASYSYGSYNQIQVFNTSNYTAASTSVIPVSVTTSSTLGYASQYATRLARWGTNGLAFRTTSGVYSLRSNLVKDLSSTSADLGVSLSGNGGNATGANTTYTATVTNAGPSAATNIALTAALPSTGVLVSVTPSAGSCSSSNGLSCNLGGLANGGSATVTFVVQQIAAGTSSLSVQVSASENDPVASNNQATASVTVTGNAYNLTPVVTAITPSAILAGATADATITVTGSGFASGSTVQLGGAPLATNFTSSTTLTATVPAAKSASLGWAPVTVSTSAPGGGISAALPLSFYSVLTLGLNHILYDPYSRNIMASVGSGSSSVTGNSIVAITPDTATVGTPVAIGSQPTNMALTSDGQILYTILTGSQSIARFNMLTQQPDFTYAVPSNSSFDGGIALRGIAAQPGTENTIALDIASFSGNAIYDFNPTTKTAAIRGQASGPYSGSCIQFLDANNLLAFDTDTSGATLDHYTVTSAGLTYYNYQQYTESTLNRFGCFKLSGGLAFANAGGIANPATSPATQVGVFQVSGGGTFSTSQTLAPDASLQRAFFLAATSATSNAADGIVAYNNNTLLQSGAVSLNIPTVEGTSSYSGIDLIRWGQDGLALLTSSGHVYLLRGAAVVPQLLTQNSAATLTAASTTSIAHGSGNTLLTLTGSNFLPGTAVLWNGSYRTTTIVDATHLNVAIPAADLSAAGSATLTVVNPNGTPSSGLTFTIN